MQITKEFINVDPVLVLQNNFVKFSKELFANYFRYILSKSKVPNNVNSNNVKINFTPYEKFIVKINFETSDAKAILDVINKFKFTEWSEEKNINFKKFKTSYDEQKKCFYLCFKVNNSSFFFNLLVCRTWYYYGDVLSEQFYGRCNNVRRTSKTTDDVLKLIDLLLDIRHYELIMLNSKKKFDWNFELSNIMFSYFNNNLVYKFLNKLDALMLFESESFEKENASLKVWKAIRNYQYADKLTALAGNELFLETLKLYSANLRLNYYN